MHKHRCFYANGREISFEEFNLLLRQKVKKIAGTEDVSGFELYSILRMLTNMYDALLNQSEGEGGISTARMGILMRLMLDEKLGVTEPLTPTELSRFQNVSKNTISSLIRGLEEQGLVTREIDQTDKRIFRLRITEEGKRLVLDATPRKARFLNSLISEMTEEEVQSLISLLTKLRGSMIHQIHQNKNLRNPHENSPEGEDAA